jgi:bifunctional DNase/RNase
MKCDLVYEDFEDVFPFQNIHVKTVIIDQFSKTVYIAVIWNQQDNPGGHFVGLHK